MKVITYECQDCIKPPKIVSINGAVRHELRTGHAVAVRLKEATK